MTEPSQLVEKLEQWASVCDILADVSGPLSRHAWYSDAAALFREAATAIKQPSADQPTAEQAQCNHEKCIAETQAAFDATLDQALDRAEKAEAEAARLRAAIRWALGEEGEFGEEPPPLAGKYRQRFWWREELRRRTAPAQEQP